MPQTKYAAVILAAGKGTRMNEGQASPIPKVMFKAAGKPIIDWSVGLTRKAGISKIVLVVGYKKELVQDYFGDKVEYADQTEQLGTGHAVMMAKEILLGKSDAVIVFYGDNPLYKTETIKKLIDLYETQHPARHASQLAGVAGRPTIAMLSVEFADPVFWAFGRVLRDGNGDVIGIREQKDCTKEQLKIKESNTGFYIFDAAWLWQNVDQLSNQNVQQEYYLTDLIEMAVAQKKKIIAMTVSEENEALGINTPEQLKKAEAVLQSRA